MEFDPLLSYLFQYHTVTWLTPFTQKTQYPGCFPKAQAQLIKHKPQSYLPEGDTVFSHDPFGIEEVSRFSETQTGFSFHGPSPQEVCPKEKTLF